MKPKAKEGIRFSYRQIGDMIFLSTWQWKRISTFLRQNGFDVKEKIHSQKTSRHPDTERR